MSSSDSNGRVPLFSGLASMKAPRRSDTDAQLEEEIPIHKSRLTLWRTSAAIRSASTSYAMLRACGAAAPASVPALVRARLARPASAVASSSSALEELAADRKGPRSLLISRPPSPSLCRHSVQRLYCRPLPRRGARFCSSRAARFVLVPSILRVAANGSAMATSCLLKRPSELRICFPCCVSIWLWVGRLPMRPFPELGRSLLDTVVASGK